MRWFAGPLFVAATVFVSSSTHTTAQAPAPRVDFVRDVQPILQASCIECHGPDKQMNGFRLDRRRDAMRGGTITVIAPGNADASRLYLRLIGTRYGRQMPAEGHLDAAQIDIVKRWIDEGASWPDSASGDAPDVPLDAAAVKAFDALRSGRRADFLALTADNPRLSTLRGPAGATPLMMAALYGDAALVKTLLDAGADPNVANDAGATPLMWGVTDLATTRLLVEHGADVNATSHDRRLPMLIACGIRGNKEVVAYLLDHGANPSAVSPGLVDRMTPLAEAAKQGDEEIVRLLLARGADPKIAGFLPMAFAMRARCKGCIDALTPGLPAPLLTPVMLLAAPPLGPALGVAALLERGADANGRGPNGYPMLLLAAASDAQSEETVRALLARGADVNARGPNGETALMLARQHGRSGLVDVLVKAGASDAGAPAPPVAFAPAHSSAEAIARSLPLLQNADRLFLAKVGCVSCHNNTLTASTIALARRHGLAVDESIARSQVAKIGAYIDDWRERNLQGEGIPGDHDSMGATLVALADQGYPPDAATDAMARFIHLQQAADGHWPTVAHRPPLESGDIHATVVSVHGLQTYAPANQRAAIDADLRKAAVWIAAAQPSSTEERAYQLLGLAWTSASKEAIGSAGRTLAAEQRADGGWAQISTLDSDAYASGQALVALMASGAMTPNDPPVQRGVQFLLKTQLTDGSWFVPSRAIPIQPYVDAGFPHGKHQFISAAATNWATQALIYATRPVTGRASAPAPRQSR